MGTTLIFGGTGGIGAALARRLASAGRKIHLAARDGRRLQTLATELDAGHSVCDVTDPDAIKACLADIDGPIEGLAYAVGSIDLKPLARLSPEDMLAAYRLNALGAALAIQSALPGLKAAGEASILLFSTVAVAQGFPNHAAIAMAKGAIEGLTRSLAAELAPRIRVNCIAPSLTRTKLAEPLLANAQMAEAIAAMHPLQRLGTPDDIAAMAALLLSPESGWISGQVIGIDGGRARLRAKG